MNRSAASVSNSARRIASTGIAWPKEIVAVFDPTAAGATKRRVSVAFESGTQFSDLIAAARNRGNAHRSSCRVAR